MADRGTATNVIQSPLLNVDNYSPVLSGETAVDLHRFLNVSGEAVAIQ